MLIDFVFLDFYGYVENDYKCLNILYIWEEDIKL